MSEDKNFDIQEAEQQISKYLNLSEVQSQILNANKTNATRINLDINHLREWDPVLTKHLIHYPLKLIPIFEKNLNEILDNFKGEKVQTNTSIQEKKKDPIRVNFQGMLGPHLVSPRGLTAELTNQFVGVQGIVTRISPVRPKLIYSSHYCEETKKGSIKEYSDKFTISETETSYNRTLNANFENGKAGTYMNNAVPVRDINSNPLTFEYGLSKFRDNQTILIQEPPERTPLGQLPRSIEVILEDDLVDKVKPGDRVQINGVFKCVTNIGTPGNGFVKTILIGTDVQQLKNEVQQNEFSMDDMKKIRELSKKKNVFEILSNSIAPGIYGHNLIKKALILQLLGGNEKNLEDGTHLRGDINILMVGDPSTAKSQFLRYMLNTAQNCINTTGRGSTGVGLTAAVVVDKDTGERHLEAGAMVLGDKGIVCIDEFDKMNEIDRVAIHEVMEQQTVTIAKAGIHVSLNARCSVLAAANPIYGQYQQDLPASRNIGFPDSLLSRFDLCFVVLDEQNSELDRRISDRVINNHMFTIDASKLGDEGENTVIEPEINENKINNKKTNVYEKYNQHLHGKEKKEILTRKFLRKYIYYAKTKSEPELTSEAVNFISKSWMKLREKSSEEEFAKLVIPVTVRTLESLIRLATAFAKARLSQKVEKQDCLSALELLSQTIFNETDDQELEELNENEGGMELVEDEEENKKKSKKNKIKEKTIPLKEDEEESVKRSKKSKIKEKEEIDELIDAPIEQKIELTNDHNNFVFKYVLELCRKSKNETITVDELWNAIKNQKERKTLKIDKNNLVDICTRLEEDAKLFISETQEITLI